MLLILPAVDVAAFSAAAISIAIVATAAAAAAASAVRPLQLFAVARRCFRFDNSRLAFWHFYPTHTHTHAHTHISLIFCIFFQHVFWHFLLCYFLFMLCCNGGRRRRRRCCSCLLCSMFPFCRFMTQ